MTLVIFVSLTTSGGCGASSKVIYESRLEAPSRSMQPARWQGERRHYFYWASDVNSAEEAHELAYLSVLTKQIAAELGVTVEGDTESFEKEENGVYSYRFVSRAKTRRVPVFLDDVRLHDRYEVCRRIGRRDSCDGYVEVSISRSELAAAARQARRKVGLLWECQSEIPESCAVELEQAVRRSAEESGIVLLGKSFEMSSDLEPLASENDLAYVFKVVLQATIIGSKKSGKATAYYARGTGSAEMVETRHGKVVGMAATDPIKDGGYSKTDALRFTLQEITKSLCLRIQGSEIPSVFPGEQP